MYVFVFLASARLPYYVHIYVAHLDPTTSHRPREIRIKTSLISIMICFETIFGTGPDPDSRDREARKTPINES